MSLAYTFLLPLVGLCVADQAGANSPGPPEKQTLMIVVGAGGEEAYAEQFAAWADRLQTVAEANSVECLRIGAPETPDGDDLTQLETTLAAQPHEHPEPLWIVLIGHGTFDGRQAKFNLRGPDLTAATLQQWLTPFQRTVVIVNCASSSSPFLNALTGENRVIVTATKSGYQYNFARLGDYFTQAIGDPQADLDKDGQTSLLEAYLLASSRVEEYYRQEARLATEQALLDDNGDGRGTPASWFRGVRAVKKAQGDAEVDGLRAHQLHLVRSAIEVQMPPELRARRDALELQISNLREQKPQMDEAAYYGKLLPIMTELAQLYESVEKTSSSDDSD